MHQRCNVIIRDAHFQELHHALGCPWPSAIMQKTPRNYFAVEHGCKTSDRMRAHPHWSDGSEKFGMDYFHVTAEGKQALLEYMRDNVEFPPLFELTFRDQQGSLIIRAKSRSAARYAAYLQADIDWSFMEYAAEIKSVRKYNPNHVPAA